jgi:hypothetical protein
MGPVEMAAHESGHALGYRATLSWRDGEARCRMAIRLYVHRRLPGGRG